MKKFINNIYSFICEHNMIESSDRIVVGLSGGADSVCLLLALSELSYRIGIGKRNIFAVHVNHMIRGEEADGDEEFSRQLCEKAGIVFESYNKDIKAYAAEVGCTVEEAGRKIRYECFEQAAEKYNCNKIAVAHNKNDLAETVIFNMIRGSGLKGMSGIKPVRDNIVRPLLDVTRDQIEEYLSACNQPYRNDSTNDTLDYDRNKIRHMILPAMMEVNNGAVRHICHMAEEANNSYSFIHSKALEKYDGYVEDDDFGRTVTLDVNKIYKYSPVLQEHVIHEAIGDVAGMKKDITRRHVMSVVGLLYQDTGRVVELPYRIRARRSYNNLIITNKQDTAVDYCIDIDCDGVYKIPEWGSIEVSFIDNDTQLEVPKKTYTKMADYGKIKFNLCIRTPEDGDYIIIDSIGNTKKLSRVFIDNKVDREKRANWPVLACGSEIIWVLGLRYSEAYKIDENTTKIIYLDCIRKGE